MMKNTKEKTKKESYAIAPNRRAKDTLDSITRPQK